MLAVFGYLCIALGTSVWHRAVHTHKFNKRNIFIADDAKQRKLNQIAKNANWAGAFWFLTIPWHLTSYLDEKFTDFFDRLNAKLVNYLKSREEDKPKSNPETF